jgi:hypothetical protein
MKLCGYFNVIMVFSAYKPVPYHLFPETGLNLPLGEIPSVYKLRLLAQEQCLFH